MSRKYLILFSIRNSGQHTEYNIGLHSSKAVKVPHERLPEKVEVHGVREIMNWIKAWLMERKQKLAYIG